jgi:predicted NAD/FAD-binding protein
MNMRIAVVGAGVSGMMAAWFLQDEHEVTLFDREPFLGGHAHTFPVSLGAQTVYAETGARFFFDVSFPYLLALLRLLDVPLRWCPTHISFVDRPHRHTVVLPPRSPRHVLSLLRSARMLRHVLQLRRLAESADQVVRDRDWSMTLSEYLRHNHYSPSFGPEFIFPFISASWGAPLAEIPQFPIYSLLSVMRRSPGREAGTYEIDGGISVYTETLGKRLTPPGHRHPPDSRRIWVCSGG